MNKICLLTALSLSFTITGCAVGTMRVTSTPDKAEVLLAYEGEQPTKIGETPINMDSRLISENRGRFVTLTLKKEGYQTEAVMFPTGLVKSSIDVSTRLDEYKLPLQCQDQTTAVEKIARGIASVQQLTQKNALSEALQQLNILTAEYPNISVLHDLTGNIHYMGKNLEMALKSYEKSLRIDPSNQDTQRIVGKIRSIMGVRSPAGRQ